MIEEKPEVVYKCARCGECCKWEGDVCLEEGEIDVIAGYLNLSAEDFISRFCRLRRNRQGLSLIDLEDGSCIMLEKGACRINDVKPEQCRQFPNGWNFPGWRDRCKAVPHVKDKKKGVVDD